MDPANCYAYQVDLGILTFASLPSCQHMERRELQTHRTTGYQIVGFGGILLIDDKIIEYLADVPQSFKIELLFFLGDAVRLKL